VPDGGRRRGSDRPPQVEGARERREVLGHRRVMREVAGRSGHGKQRYCMCARDTLVRIEAYALESPLSFS
jgi:hypothetical protein